MTNVDQIPWNAFAIFEMSNTSWSAGKLRMKDGLENHSNGQCFLLEQWLNITRFQHEINQDFINLVRKNALIYSLWMVSGVSFSTPGGFGTMVRVVKGILFSQIGFLYLHEIVATVAVSSLCFLTCILFSSLSELRHPVHEHSTWSQCLNP